MLIVKEKLKKCFYDCLGGAGLLCRDRPAVTSKAEASRSHAQRYVTQKCPLQTFSLTICFLSKTSWFCLEQPRVGRNGRWA